jgi:alcohol dehydrogenase
MVNSFQFSQIPKLVFGAGKFSSLKRILSEFKQPFLFLTGKKSFSGSERWIQLRNELAQPKIEWFHNAVDSEPSVDFIDECVESYREKNIGAVIAIGGGSVMDSGKAISAMLTQDDSVVHYLEGVGDKVHNGAKTPFIAVPTTSGTGSEATKNAVISKVGPDGFKKSLRHDNFIPDIALIDPELTLGTPQETSASCGMDAFAQLLESYVSKNASPMTDALAWDGLKYMKDSLLMVCSQEGINDIDARSKVSYAAWLSGITLANAGLGTVHGFASAIGGFFHAPHGTVCGTLTSRAVELNIRAMEERDNNNPALQKYAQIGKLLSDSREDNVKKNCDRLIEILDSWTEKLNIPRLGKYGISKPDIEKILKHSSGKNNPIELTKDELKLLLEDRV